MTASEDAPTLIDELGKIAEEDEKSFLSPPARLKSQERAELAREKAKRLARTAITHAAIERAPDAEISSVTQCIRSDVADILGVLDELVKSHEDLQSRVERASSLFRTMDAKDLMRVFAYVDSSVILAHILKMLDVLAAWFNSDRGRHAKKIAPYRARVAVAVRDLKKHLEARTEPNDEEQNMPPAESALTLMGDRRLFEYAKKAMGELRARWADESVQKSIESAIAAIAKAEAEVEAEALDD